MFGIKPEDIEQVPSQDQAPVQGPPPIQDAVYVMPEHFHPSPNKKSSNKPLVIALIILVLMVMATATYFFYDMWQKNNNQPSVATNSNINQNEGNINVNDEATNVLDNLNLATTTNDGAPTSTTPTSTTPNDNPPPQISTSTPPQLSSDSDNDGLTDAEESVIGSSPINPDTDGDTYFDGAEISNNYNPLVASTTEEGRIFLAAFITTVNTNFPKDNFKTITIKNWVQNLVPVTSQAMITIDTGEIIKISAKDNPAKLSGANWYAQTNNVPLVVLNQLKTIAAGTLSGVFSMNGLEAYIADPVKSKIYTFEYIMDASAPMRYPSIFAMMIRNFVPVSGSATSSAR